MLESIQQIRIILAGLNEGMQLLQRRYENLKKDYDILTRENINLKNELSKRNTEQRNSADIEGD